MCSDEVSLNLVVEDEDEGATGTSEDVGEATLEEGLESTLVGVDLLEAVDGAIVELVLTSLAGSHHESTSDGIKGVGDNTSRDGDDLSEGPDGEDVGLLHVLEHHNLASVEHAEVGGTISDDTNDGDTETIVESAGTTLGGALLKAVNKSGELSIFSRANIGSESGTSEVERIHKRKRSGSSSTTGGAVSNEEHTRLSLGVVRAQVLLVEILAGEVDSLSGEITNDVSQVTSPKSAESLLLDDSAEAVTDAVVSLVSGNVGVGILHLKEELDSLNRSDDGLGDGSGNTTDHEVDQEVLFFRSFTHSVFIYVINWL